MKHQRNYAAPDIEAALVHHRAGRLQEAEAIYKKMPFNADALHLRGVIAHTFQRNDEAINLISQAIRIKPTCAPFYYSLEAVYRGAGRLNDAADCYRSLLARAPANALAYNNLGNILKEQGNMADAIGCYQQALAIEPNFAEAHANLGVAYHTLGHSEQAIVCFQQAITCKPAFAEAYNDLGAALQATGKLSQAIACGRKAIALKQDFVIAHYNLGCNLRDAGQMEEAVLAYQQAIKLAPAFVDGYNDLGVTYAHMNKLDEAVECYQKALELRPGFASAYNNLGHVFQRQGKPDAAIVCHQKSLEFDPDSSVASVAFSNILLCMQYSAVYTPAEMFNTHLQYAERFEAPLKSAWPMHTNQPDPDKRLKIGYVSPDFNRHAVAYFIEPVLLHHDKTQVEVFCYYSGTQYDAVTNRLQVVPEHWILCKHLTEDQLAQRIREDGIDILIDLAGHTGGNRLLAFARKPAPVQVSYLGYPCTTGLTAVDYRISDALAEPVGMTERFNVEQLWRLPEIFCCYRAHDNSPAVIDHPPFVDNGFITFGCFNNFSKVTDSVLSLWSKILHRVPASKLMLEIHGLDHPVLRAEVEERIVRSGLPLDRLILVPRKPENQYALYNRIDIALDPFPCNGGTTSLDTVWMGVPFVSLAGGHFTSRMGVTILTNVGLPQLIAQTSDEYARIAADLALDAKKLHDVRAGLRERVKSSSLMDAPRFTRHLEQAYRGMWQAWCAKAFSIGETAAQPSDDAIAFNNRANALKDQGRLDDAIALYQQALAIKPDFVEAYNNLGVALADQGKFDDAIGNYLKALSIKLDFVETYNNLGLAFSAQNNPEEAIKFYQTAITLRPDFVEAHNNLGIDLKEKGQFDEAILCFQRALAIAPHFPEAHCNLGITYHRQGRPDEAIACYQRALALRPNYLDAFESLLLALQYSSKYTPQEVFNAHVQFAERFETPLKAAWTAHTNHPEPNKRLKIGYVSPDFHKHAVAYFIEPVLQHHDKSQVEVFCYQNHKQFDAVTQRLKDLADHWVLCKHLTDDQLAQRIRDDGIDILVDLAGHTGGNRLLTFARKPAPVQVTYLGYPSTTGLSSIDYRITDCHAEPSGMTEQFNVEQLWRLPEIFCCYRAHDNSPAVIDHSPSADNGYITFGCFNNFAKVTDPTLMLWARILNQLPTVRLMLEIHGIDNIGLRTQVENRLTRLGVPMERLIMVPRKPENQYVLYNQIDIALDPFPCNGGTTSLDTLWMGVPFVTLAGNQFTSRMGVTILTNAALPQLIAQDEDEYVQIAIDLAEDMQKLHDIRGGLRECVQRSALMDAPRFTRHLEDAYRGMWQAWCNDIDKEGSSS